MSKPCIAMYVIVILVATALFARQAVSADSPTKPTFIIQWCAYGSGNYTSNSSYETNLKSVLSGLDRQAFLTSPFFNKSEGEGAEEKVFGQYYCSGNIDPKLCSDCVHNAAQLVVSLCPFAKVAFIWYRECTLGYDKTSMFNAAVSVTAWSTSVKNITSDLENFKNVFVSTVKMLINESAYGNDIRRFAQRTGKVSEFETIYCQVQCSPDLNSTMCDSCLRTMLIETANLFFGRLFVYVFGANCQIMYSTDTTFHSISPLSQPPQSPSNPPPTLGQGPRKRVAVFVAVPVVVALFLLFSVVGFWVCKRNRRHAAYSHMSELENVESLQYDISTIRTATSNFSASSKLGEGGFGSVYKGRLQNGQEIAVKRLFQKSDQQGIEEFKTEVLVVAKLQHRNLVKLLGYCLTGREKLLIFELLPNSSLDHFYKDAVKRASLDWTTRYKIIVGVARGLHYLHEESRLKIIHRDLKPHNILLDENMNAKIADFGLAKSFNLDQSMASTHNIVGTYGYMSPEYAMTGHFSTKSDIYSLGVIVLEIVTGKRNIVKENQPSLFHHAWSLWNEDNALEIVDPTLMNNYSTEEAMTCIQIALLCIQEEPGSRPNMAKAVSVLNGHSTDLPKPLPPLIFSFTEGGSGIKYSTTVTTQGSEEHYTSETSCASVPVAKNDDLNPR